MIANLFDRNLIKVLALFLISPGSRYSRDEIKKGTEMNNVPLDFSLNKMLGLEIIKKEKNLFILNQHSSLIDIIKKIREEYKEFALPLKIYHILIEVSNKISGVKYVKNAYLFGSYAKLIYHENSDIDIAVIFENKIKNRRVIEKKITRFVLGLEKEREKEIEIHFFLEKDMKEKDPLIKEILRNGKKIL